MKLLFRLAVQNRRHFTLLIFTFLAMCMVTVATQGEMFALKVMTTKGVDFFELFAPKGEGETRSVDSVSREFVVEILDEMDSEGTGEITKGNAANYMARFRGDNPIDQAVAWLDKRTGVLKEMSHLAIFLLSITFIKTFALFAKRYGAALIGIRVSRDLRQRYFEHIQSLPISFYQKHDIGTISARAVQDASWIADALNFGMINYLEMPFTVITTFTFCLMASWQLTLLVCVMFPAIVLPIVYLSKAIKRVSRQVQKNQERFTSVLIDFLAGIQTIKVFAMEKLSMRKYREENDRMGLLAEKSAKYDSSARPALHVVGTIMITIILFFGLSVLQMHISQLLFFCGLLHMFYEPIKKFAEQNTRVQMGIVAAERMFEVLNIKSHIQDKPDATELTSFKDSIEFDDVWFKYEDEWTLKGLSFTIKKGETVAIVGATGAGKSTVVQLLPRLYDVAKGAIRIDGVPLQDYTQRSIREQIAFVPQKPFLFLDTVAENIAFGRNFSQEAIEDAAKRAHASEFIEQMPDGYNTMLAETGKNLSGGQQQRLAIARALVKDAPILVMDEATSSLDGVSENRIKDAIESLHGDVTQILIAHRFSTIENADRIIFLQNGQKLAEGTKEELLRSCPPFREMYELMHISEEVAAV